MNLPFQKHEQDLWVCGDVFYRGRTGANLTSHNIAEQMNHILLPLKKHTKKALRQTAGSLGAESMRHFSFGHNCSNQTYTPPPIICCQHNDQYFLHTQCYRSRNDIFHTSKSILCRFAIRAMRRLVLYSSCAS